MNKIKTGKSRWFELAERIDRKKNCKNYRILGSGHVNSWYNRMVSVIRCMNVNVARK